MQMNAFGFGGTKEIGDNSDFVFVHTLVAVTARCIVAPHDPRPIKFVRGDDTPIFVRSTMTADAQRGETGMFRGRQDIVAALARHEQMLVKITLS